MKMKDLHPRENQRWHLCHHHPQRLRRFCRFFLQSKQQKKTRRKKKKGHVCQLGVVWFSGHHSLHERFLHLRARRERRKVTKKKTKEVQAQKRVEEGEKKGKKARVFVGRKRNARRHVFVERKRQRSRMKK